MIIKIISRKHHLKVDVLEDPIAHQKDRFIQCCQESRFVILGFLATTFQDKVTQIIDWSKESSENLVYALDSKGRFSHPRRWRTEPHLMDSAVQRLVSVLQNKMVRSKMRSFSQEHIFPDKEVSQSSVKLM